MVPATSFRTQSSKSLGRPSISCLVRSSTTGTLWNRLIPYARNARTHCRVGMGKAAADGAAVADLIVRDVGHCLAQQRVRSGQPPIVLDVAPANPGAKPNAALADGDVAEPGNPAQIDEQTRRLCGRCCGGPIASRPLSPSTMTSRASAAVPQRGDRHGRAGDQVIGAARRRRHPFGDIGQPADDVIDRHDPTLPLRQRERARARETAGNQRPWPADKVEQRSRRRRPRGALFCDGSRGSCSMR